MIVDFLTDRAIEDYEPMNFDFLKKNLMAILKINEEESVKKKLWKMYFDGASNAFKDDIGAILMS